MKILITGTAGFIGFHLAEKLLERGDTVFGIDNINNYYDPALKYARLDHSGIDPTKIEYAKEIRSKRYPSYSFMQLNLEDRENLEILFAKEKFDRVINLAAQAGVRYSIENPHAYIESNIVGFMNILECVRHHGTEHLLYASSSSVYGMNKKTPFSTDDSVDHPVSLYAATKKANELMAHTYSHLYGIPSTGLRFFTVYGPWGRPDMAYFLFVNKILEGKTIDIFNNGYMERDFTYVDDIVEGIVRILDNPPEKTDDEEEIKKRKTAAPYRVSNIGNSSPVNLLKFVETIEKCLGKEAKKNFLPMQPGDVPITWADVSDLQEEFGYKPTTTLEKGIGEFVQWYKNYYGIKE